MPSHFLRRYWVKFQHTPAPSALALGVGVSAFGKEDALALIGERVFVEHELPPILEMIEDVDVRTLDEGHVIPNMGVVARRGIWFPLGYDEPLKR